MLYELDSLTPENAKVGTKVVSLEYGAGEIINIESKIQDDRFPVEVRFNTMIRSYFTFTGKNPNNWNVPDLFVGELPALHLSRKQYTFKLVSSGLDSK